MANEEVDLMQRYLVEMSSDLYAERYCVCMRSDFIEIVVLFMSRSFLDNLSLTSISESSKSQKDVERSQLICANNKKILSVATQAFVLHISWLTVQCKCGGINKVRTFTC